VIAHVSARLRYLTRRHAEVTATVSGGILGGSLMVLIGMGFQPGWANGWPMGISKHTVFASFVTVIFVIASTSGSAAVFVALCHVAERIAKRTFVGWISFLVLLSLVFVAVLVACTKVYAVVFADIVRDWP
jgi:hypothetical protein